MVRRMMVGVMALSFLFGEPLDRAHIEVSPDAGLEYRLSMEQGEADLNRLAHTSYAEDAWLFVNGIWRDVGSNISEIGVTVDGQSDLEMAMKYALPGQPIVLYHIHLYDRKHLVPSQIDIARHVLRKRRLGVVGHHAVSRMVNGLGVWELNTDIFLEMTYSENLEQEKGDFYRLEGGLRDAKEALLVNPESPTSIQKYIDDVKKLGVIMSYRPIGK
ncbi:hypothetical protein ACFL1B_06430 [Nanoarchaeota archaeon]